MADLSSYINIAANTVITNGILTLATGNSTMQSNANSSLDPLNPNVSTMTFTPDQGYSYQALVLDPTAPGHIHLRGPSGSGNIDEPAANLFLGGELSSFEVGASYGGAPNVFVHSNGNTWTFGTDGNLVTPGLVGTYIKSAPGGYMGIAAIDDGGDLPAQLVSINSNSGLGTTAISAYANNATIQANINGDIKSWNFDNAGNLTLPGNTFAVNYANGTQVSLGGGLPLANGSSNININTANGNVTVSVAGTANILEISNSLATLNSNLTLVPAPDSYSIIQSTGELDIYSGDGNAAGFNLNIIAGTGNAGGGVGIFGGSGTGTGGGNVTIWGGWADTVGTGGRVDIQGGAAGRGGDILIAGGPSTNVFSPVTGNVEIIGGNVRVKAWTFDDTGNLTFGVAAGPEPVIRWSTAPVSNTSEGYAGQAAYDSGGNLFVCVATNTWAKFSGTTSW